MFLLKNKIDFALGIFAFVASMQLHAMPRQEHKSEVLTKSEPRSSIMREPRDPSITNRDDSESNMASDQANIVKRREAIRSAIILRRSERLAERTNRLSPEERMSLRRQIREARMDIYQRKNQKSQALGR